MGESPTTEQILLWLLSITHSHVLGSKVRIGRFLLLRSF